MKDKGKNRVSMMILGEEYILRGTSSPEEMHRVGLYVDQLMRSLAEKNMQMSKHKVAVLAALNLADELLKLKKNGESPDERQQKRGENDELV